LDPFSFGTLLFLRPSVNVRENEGNPDPGEAYERCPSFASFLDPNKHVNQITRIEHEDKASTRDLMSCGTNDSWTYLRMKTRVASGFPDCLSTFQKLPNMKETVTTSMPQLDDFAKAHAVV
jgi:hypothetical protein